MASPNDTPKPDTQRLKAIRNSHLDRALLLSALVHLGIFVSITLVKHTPAPQLRVGRPAQKTPMHARLLPPPTLPTENTRTIDEQIEKKEIIHSLPLEKALPNTAPPPFFPVADTSDVFFTTGYFTSNQLTAKPKALTLLEIEDINQFHNLHSGESIIVLEVWIDNEGIVSAVNTKDHAAPDSFRHAAIAAFRRMIFTPGEINGFPVGSIIRVEVRLEDFRLPAQ